MFVSGDFPVCLPSAEVQQRCDLIPHGFLCEWTASRREDNGAQLGERLHRVPATDPPDAAGGSSAAAERQVALPVVGGHVDVDHAAAHVLRVAEPSAQILGEYR